MSVSLRPHSLWLLNSQCLLKSPLERKWFEDFRYYYIGLHNYNNSHHVFLVCKIVDLVEHKHPLVSHRSSMEVKL